MKTLQLPLSNKQVDIKLNPLGIIEAKKEAENIENNSDDREMTDEEIMAARSAKNLGRKRRYGSFPPGIKSNLGTHDDFG